MASVLAIVSKAVFAKMAPKSVKVGDLVETDRYTSQNKAFESLADGGAIFLVTVRSPDEDLWLVGIIENPEHDGEAWVGEANGTRITDVTKAIPKLRFATGAGLKAKKGALGMSLQTPRVLTDEDDALLRSLEGGAAKKKGKGKAAKGSSSPANDAYLAAVEATPKARAAAAAAAKLALASEGPGLRIDNLRKPFETVDDLRPSERKQLDSLLAQEGGGGSIESAADNEEWSPMELVDVIDEASGKIRYQLYLWPYGSGALFEAGTVKNVANVCQHGFEMTGKDDKGLRVAMAIAFQRAKKKLNISEFVEFGLDEGGDEADEADE